MSLRREILGISSILFWKENWWLRKRRKGKATLSGILEKETTLENWPSSIMSQDRPVSRPYLESSWPVSVETSSNGCLDRCSRV